jgi:hypothetical protein
MTKDESLRLALEALVMLLDNYVPEATEEDISQVETTITAIKAALEAKDEPVAWVNQSNIASAKAERERCGQGDTHTWSEKPTVYHSVPLYITPPPVAEPHKRTWVGLTLGDVDDIIQNTTDKFHAVIVAIDKLERLNT